MIKTKLMKYYMDEGFVGFEPNQLKILKVGILATTIFIF